MQAVALGSRGGAFDRSYDETYELFLPGDPVVPIAAEDLE